MAFADDYQAYLSLYLMNQADEGFMSLAPADRIAAMERFATLTAEMSNYQAAGLVAIDASRNMYIPTATSGVTVAPSSMPAPIYPDLSSSYNPNTGTAVPPGYKPPTVNTAPGATPMQNQPYGTPTPTQLPPTPAPSTTLNNSGLLTLGLIAAGAYMLGRR